MTFQEQINPLLLHILCVAVYKCKQRKKISFTVSGLQFCQHGKQKNSTSYKSLTLAVYAVLILAIILIE
jgi:hypothetical protein